MILAASSRRSAWWAGTVTLGVAKIIENMEIGHNVMHGQWDWMNDPEIHSSTWEWDMAGVVQALAVHSQLHAPQVHQHPGHGRRCGLRGHPGHPRHPVEAVQSLRQPTFQHASGDRLRVGRRSAVPGARQDLQRPRRSHGDVGAGTRVRRQGRPAAVQGLRRLPGTDVPVARCDLQVDAQSQRGGQRDSQRVVERGDLLWPFP